MSKKSREEIIHEATNNLLEMFRTGEMPEAIALTVIHRHQGDDQPSCHWSIGNRILMLAQGTLDARGFEQWRKVGRFVKKGSSAIWILAPITKKIEDGDEDIVIISGFRPIPVYRYEDTDGKALDRGDYTPREQPPLWEVAEKIGITINYAPALGDYYGSFNPIRNEITLCSTDPVVFYHELGHAVHHIIGDQKAIKLAEKEIVAETTAAVLCLIEGIPGFESQAYHYIAHYTAEMNKKDVLKCIMKLLGDVEQILLKIFEVSDSTGRSTLCG